MQTLDGGLRRIAAIDRRWTLPGQTASVIRCAGGVFGTCATLDLLPDQHVLIDLDPADPATGGLPDALAVLAPAAALVALPGVQRAVHRAPVQAVTLMFDEEEIVWAATGVLAHCPAARDGAAALPLGESFPPLDEAAARRLLTARTARIQALPAGCECARDGRTCAPDLRAARPSRRHSRCAHALDVEGRTWVNRTPVSCRSLWQNSSDPIGIFSRTKAWSPTGAARRRRGVRSPPSPTGSQGSPA